MLTTVKLYGHLGEKFGKEFEFDINTVNESLRALMANFRDFKQYLLTNSEPGYRVYVDEMPVMDEQELGLAITKHRVIKYVPVVAGAEGGKSIGKIILGAVLVVAAVVLTFTGYGAPIGAYLGSSGIATLGLTGLTMIAGGVSELMTSDRKSTRLNSSHIPLSRMPSSA